MMLLVLLLLVVEVVVRVTDCLAGLDSPRCVGVILYLKTHQVSFM